jgi:hypothetical protein
LAAVINSDGNGMPFLIPPSPRVTGLELDAKVGAKKKVSDSFGEI